MIPTIARCVVKLLTSGICFASFICSQGLAQSAPDCVAIERKLPPLGLAASQTRRVAWEQRLASVMSTVSSLPPQDACDVEVLAKACSYAILHQEFYRKQDFAKLDRLLTLAEERLNQLAASNKSWTKTKGRQIRGFRSEVDGSVQPVGLVFPSTLPQDRKVPLYVWLHGRGDKKTDLHFLCERLDQDGQIAPEGAIVLHPFGRQCVGYKSAGETDVMEAIEFACANYPVDEQRIVLMGFSMGGAGVWHVAAHYGERFVAASPGAGFAETSRYQRLKPADFPPEYEQTLWRVYDVPGYVRNLFNLPVVAYSGEIDKQIQAANVMAEAFAAEGRELAHIIGPGMGHKYHPDSLAKILQEMAAAAEAGLPEQVKLFSIQSPHQRYAKRHWLTIDGVDEQYGDTRVDAKLDNGRWRLTTQNAERLVIDANTKSSPSGQVVVDGQALAIEPGSRNRLMHDGKQWQLAEEFPVLRKHPGMSGPIDDAFIDPFLVVIPTGKSSNSQVDAWVACELEFFVNRWRALFRGTPRMKQDRLVTEEDMARYHLVLWGTPESNVLVKRLFDATGDFKLPVAWGKDVIQVGERSFQSASNVPVLIFPNASSSEKYVVLNSGPTFRPAHDRTNSLQNPHLPDWAVISLAEPRGAERPGGVAAAGFFDGFWQLDPARTW